MRNIIFKTIYNLGVPNLLRTSKEDALTVLSLHRISDERDYFYNPIKPKSFEQLLDYCLKYYSITNFNEVDKKTVKPKLILSFDDGYYDFIENAIPILKQKGLPSNHNVVNSSLNNNSTIWTHKLNYIFNFLRNNKITDNACIAQFNMFKGNWAAYYMVFFKKMLCINQKLRNEILDIITLQYNLVYNIRMMDWNDIQKCVDDYDVEIGCHTYNHDSLSSIKDQNYYDLEIKCAIDELSNKLHKNINILALPNGEYSNSTIEYLKNIDIKFLLLSDNKVFPTKNLTKKLNLVNRIGMVDESIHEMILRMELFHTKFRK